MPFSEYICTTGLRAWLAMYSIFLFLDEKKQKSSQQKCFFAAQGLPLQNAMRRGYVTLRRTNI